MFFQNFTYSRLFFKVATDDSFVNHTGCFWRISLSHPFFYAGWFLGGAVAAIHSFRGYIYLLRTVTFLEDFSDAFDFFKGSLFILLL